MYALCVCIRYHFFMYVCVFVCISAFVFVCIDMFACGCDCLMWFLFVCLLVRVCLCVGVYSIVRVPVFYVCVFAWFYSLRKL